MNLILDKTELLEKLIENRYESAGGRPYKCQMRLESLCVGPGECKMCPGIATLCSPPCERRVSTYRPWRDTLNRFKFSQGLSARVLPVPTSGRTETAGVPLKSTSTSE